METHGNKGMKQASLKSIAKRNSVFSLILFVILVGIIFVAFQRDKQSMGELEQVYKDHFNVERFKASLFDVMSPLNDFALTADKSNFNKLKDAISNYEATYPVIKANPRLTAADHKTLQTVHNLMQEVMNIANDIVEEKIAANQAGTFTVLAQNLVLGAQSKLDSIVSGLEKSLEEASAERAADATMQLYILLAFIVLIIILLEVLTRKLVDHANELSKASSDVASGIGSFISAAKEQADASEQQTRFMEKVVKGLEMLVESGSRITSTATAIEKANNVAASFAKGGAMESSALLDAVSSMKSRDSEAAERGSTIARQSDQLIKTVDQMVEAADEAQLAAVNASIESSDSGNVAEEVQRMADQIRQNADEVRGMVEQIRMAANSSAGDVLGNIEEISGRLGELMSKIQSQSEKAGTSAATVIQATNRQNERSQKLLQALKHISGLLQLSGSKLQESSEASKRLSEASESLQNMS